MSLQIEDLEIIGIYLAIIILWVVMIYALARDWKHIQALDAPIQ